MIPKKVWYTIAVRVLLSPKWSTWMGYVARFRLDAKDKQYTDKKPIAKSTRYIIDKKNRHIRDHTLASEFKCFVKDKKGFIQKEKSTSFLEKTLSFFSPSDYHGGC